MKRVLKFWPFVFYIGLIILFIKGIINKEFEIDPMWSEITYYGILFPIVSFFISVWFSITIKSNKKWFIVLLMWLPMLILSFIPYGFDYIIPNIITSMFVVIPSIVGVLLGNIFVFIKKPLKLNESKNIIFNIVSGIMLIIAFFGVEMCTLIITGTTQSGYELIKEKIVAKPVYVKKMPVLYDVIDKLKMPKGYISENYGSIESFEDIMRKSNQSQVLMAIEVVEYKNSNNITLSDVIRFNVYEEASRREAKKWLNNSEVMIYNGTKIYKNGHNAIIYKNGTYIYATLDIGSLKITKKDEEAFDQIIKTIEIK